MPQQPLPTTVQLGAPELQLHQHHFKALGGPCQLMLWAVNAGDAKRWFGVAEMEVRRIEQKYSRFRDDSVVGRINAQAGKGWVDADAETQGLLDYAEQLWQITEGRFDVTAGALVRCWDFKSAKIPTAEALALAKESTGWEKVQRQAGKVRLPQASMSLDFGGFGKEYAADAVTTRLQQAGCAHALVNLAGDVVVTGPQPADETGEPQAWQVGVQHPRQPSQAISHIALYQGALATSGDYERYFEHNGQRYCHVINALTGQPIQGMASVSVMSASCLAAGALASSALLQENTAAQWLADNDAKGLVIDQQMELQWI